MILFLSGYSCSTRRLSSRRSGVIAWFFSSMLFLTSFTNAPGSEPAVAHATRSQLFARLLADAHAAAALLEL